jgi:hypothetical protein
LAGTAAPQALQNRLVASRGAPQAEHVMASDLGPHEVCRIPEQQQAGAAR